MEYWCINDKSKPDWVQDLIDRELLIHNPTHITDCYKFMNTLMTTSPIYLYDGDGLCFENNMIGIVYNFYHNFDWVKKEVKVRKTICDCCGEDIPLIEERYNLKIMNDYRTEFEKQDVCERCFNKIKIFVNTIKEKS